MIASESQERRLDHLDNHPVEDLRTNSLHAILESLLFVTDGPVDIAKLRSVLEVEPNVLASLIDELAAALETRGLRIQKHGDAIQLVTAPEAAPYIEKLLGVQTGSKLSAAALETLAIVAYRQPITRAAIEAIRGVNCDRALATLQNRGLIEEVGRTEAVGRPILFGTTFEFLQHFGLQSVADLPPLEESRSLQPEV